MKRVLSLILVVFMLLASLTACNVVTDFFGGLFKDKGLEQAQENVKLLYINKAKDTNADFEVVPQVTIGKDVYTIEWSVNVTDGVKVVKTEDGKIMIDVNDKTDVDIPYVLTATIKSPKGKTITQTFEFNVPKFKELTWDEFAATEDDKPVVIKGVVGGIVETSKENDLYLQDENGGYFVYKLAEKPSDLGIKVGMTVRVSGIRDTYYGVYQVSNPQVEILDSTIKTVEPIDITKAFTDAKNLKDESLTRYQSMFVTIKGATVLGQDENDSTYFNFSLAGKKAYVRISSSTSMLTKEGEATFKKNVADHIGYSADITGFVSIYNNNIYIIPLNENAFSNFVVAERTPAEQVAFEKDMLKDKVNTLITEAGTTELVTTPALYKDVKISWSISENDYAKIENGKLVVSLPDEEVKVTLTATLTQGEATDTASYEVTIAAAPTIIPQIVTAPVANTSYKYFLKQNNINKTLYFAGMMEKTYYLGTTTNPAEAVDVGLEPVEGKDGEYYLYFMDGSIPAYIVAYEGTKTDGSKIANLKIEYEKERANTWTFNTEHNTPVTKLSIGGAEDTYYIGAYSSNETFGLSKISYLPSKTSFAAQFATLLDTSLVSDADKIATEKEALDIPTEYKKNGEFELPIFGSTYTQVEISWESNSEFAVVEGNILKVTQQKAAQTVILTATITSGEVTETKEITVTITAIPTTVPQVVDTPVAGTEYYFALYQGNRKELLFITGKMNGFYYETTDDIDAAVKVVLEAVEGKTDVYYLSTTVAGAKKYLNIIKVEDGDKTYYNVRFEDAAVSEYVYNTEYKTVTTVVDENTYYFGTYGNYNTFSASTIDKAPTSFVAHFYELVDTSTISDADKVAQDKEALVGPDNKYTEGTTVELPLVGKNFEDVTITWNSDSEFAVIVDGVLTITIPETETKVTITATIACGEATETVTFEITLVKPADPDQPLTYEDYMAAQDGEALSKLVNVVVTGIVSKSAGSSYNCLFVQDANGGAYYIYKMEKDPIADLKIEIGMTISVEGGKKAIYNGTHEIVAGEQGLTVTIVSNEKTPVAPVDYTEIFKDATALDDAALVGKQSLLVTLKGVIITDQNLSSGYLNFKLGDKNCYLRISSSTLGFNTADKDAFIAEHAAKKGYSADVTGIISQYNGAFYLVPVSTDAFVYGELVEQPETPENPDEPVEPAFTSKLEIVDTPVAGTEYYFGLAQMNNKTDLYITGAMDGYYYQTTEDKTASVKVVLEAVTGKDGVFYLYTTVDGAKKYLNIVKNGTYTNVVFGDTAISEYVYNTEYKTVTTDLEGATYYFGTYGTYKTFSASKIEKAATSFVAHFCVAPATTPETPETPETPDDGGNGNEEPTTIPGTTTVPSLTPVTPVAGTAYKFGFIQGNLNKTYFLTGVLSGYYMASTETFADGVEFYVEETEGGYYLYCMVDGAKKYVNMVVSGTHVNGKYEDAAATIYTYDETLKTLVTKVNDEDYIFGTRNDKTYTTLGPVKVSNNPFYAHFVTEAASDVLVMDSTTPAEGTAYKFGFIQGNLNKVYFLTGVLSGYYMASTEVLTDGVNFYIEATEGGYYLYCMVDGAKKYVNMVVSGTHVNGKYEDTAATIYTYDETLKTLVTKVNDEDYIFGTRNDKTYTTLGPVKVSNNPFYAEFVVSPNPDTLPDEPETPETPETPENPEQGGDTTQATVSKSHTDIASIAGVTAGQNTGAIGGKEIKLDDNITIVCKKETSTADPTIYSESIRIYQGGATLTIKAADGCAIETVLITLATKSGGQGPITVTGGTASALTNYVYTITANENTSEIVITTAGTTSSTRLYVANIEVQYATSGN